MEKQDEKLTESILNFIIQFEGFSSVPYKCPAGYPTIGYGHLIHPSERYSIITKTQARSLLGKDLKPIIKSVYRLIQVPLTQNQYIALISFTFNVGSAALQRSILRSKINRKEHTQVPEEMMKWIHSKGRILKGLVYRRIIEGQTYSLLI